MSFFKATATISCLTLTSRVFGFIRDVVLARLLGASAVADAFFVAIRLPNMLRQLFAEGAFNVAFVPYLNKKIATDGQPQAEKFAAIVFVWLMLLVSGLTALGVFFMKPVVLLIAPGFAHDPETLGLATLLARITFPYLIFIVATSFMGGILNTLGRFAAFAATPILLNLALIACLLLHPTGTPAITAAFGFILGGALQLVFIAVALKRSGFQLKLTPPQQHPDLKPLALKIAPTFVGVGAQQISTFLTTVLASLLMPGSISYLFYADRLSQLPLALIGIAMATALLPTLNQAFREHTQKAQRLLGQGMSVALALGLAAGVGLALLAYEVITVLFVRGAFDALDAERTSLALMAYAIGLPAYTLTKITSSAFYANHNTATPVKTALASIAISIGLMLILMDYYGHVGLAIAASVAGWCQLLLQLVLLQRHKIIDANFWRIFMPYGVKAVLVTAFMGLLLGMIKFYIPFPDGFWLQLVWLVLVVGIGGFFWLGLAVMARLHKPFLTFAASPNKSPQKQ